MNDNLKKVLDQIKNVFEKATMQQRIIMGVVLFAAIGIVIGVISFSTQKSGDLLFDNAVSQDSARKIMDVLDNEGIEYKYRNNLFYLSDKGARSAAELALVKNDAMPSDKNVWEEVFDRKGAISPMTKGEEKIKKRIALEKAITRHLEEYDFVNSASVKLTFPEREYLTDAEVPVEASIILHPAPYQRESLDDSKLMKGLRKLVAGGVDRLEEQNVHISDNTGRLLTDFEGEEENMRIKVTKAQIKITTKKELELENKIQKHLRSIFRDRADVSVRVEFDWDLKTTTNDEVIPITLKEDNPLTPYSEEENISHIQASKQKVTEDFKGQRFVPHGAAGAEEQIPPGLVDKMDRWNEYQKVQETENNVWSKRYQVIKHNQYRLKRVTASVSIDGKWEKLMDENGEFITTNGGVKYVREYHPVPDTRLASAENIVKQAIGYQQQRGDEVSVEHIPYDHSDEFALEDAELRRQKMIRQMFMIALISLLSIFVLWFTIRAIQKEIARRKRLAEEERERRQAELRQQAMLNAQEEPAAEMSMEDAARKRLYEEVANLARERPEDVASLLRTWMADEGT